jgi:hypothetical protein
MCVCSLAAPTEAVVTAAAAAAAALTIAAVEA